MDFNVKAFAQLMILSPEVALAFDHFSNSKFDIDSYEIAEHPNNISADIKAVMEITANSVVNSELNEIKAIYEQLLNAAGDDVFWDLLKLKNDKRRMQGK